MVYCKGSGISQKSYLYYDPDFNTITNMNKQAMNEISVDDYSALTKLIMLILDEWDLSAAEQFKVLNLPEDEDTPTRTLRKYRNGQPLPRNADVFERLEHIVGIFEALRTSYPHNKNMAIIWIKRCNRHFVTRPPIVVITEDGLPGLVQVRAHLDCTFDWFSS